MKWTIHELVKQEVIDNTYQDVIDFSGNVAGSDIIRISPVEISGDFEIYDNKEFVFYSDIKCEVVMACALTLKEVIVPLEFSVEDTFSTFEDENNYVIDGITIDLLPIIWSNILLEKPMRVTSPNAYDEFTYENTVLDEKPQNAFANLKHKK